MEGIATDGNSRAGRSGHQSSCDCRNTHNDDEELEGRGEAAIWFDVVNRHKQRGGNVADAEDVNESGIRTFQCPTELSSLSSVGLPDIQAVRAALGRVQAQASAVCGVGAVVVTSFREGKPPKETVSDGNSFRKTNKSFFASSLSRPNCAPPNKAPKRLGRGNTTAS